MKEVVQYAGERPVNSGFSRIESCCQMTERMAASVDKVDTMYVVDEFWISF